MCTVLLPLSGNPFAVNKHIISYHIISYHILSLLDLISMLLTLTEGGCTLIVSGLRTNFNT